MKILLIGGTRYIGRYLVKYLLEHGHDITLFHRGQTNADLFPQLERIIGDRNTDIANIGDRSFDVVIDTCGYNPEQVKLSTTFLKTRVDTYVYISSINAFEPTDKAGLTEEDATQDNDFNVDKPAWWKNQYGLNKAICEQIVEETFGKNNSLIIRPGMVIGPHDPILFFPYWLLRIRQGGVVLAPGDPDQPMQYIDVRDLTTFIADMVTKEETGVYTVTGPETEDTLESFLDTIKSVVNPEAKFSWVDSHFLMDEGVETDRDLPYWLPGSEAQGYCGINTDKARQQGLSYRDLEETTADVIAWLDQYNREHSKEPITVQRIADRDRGLDPELEKELLEKY